MCRMVGYGSLMLVTRNTLFIEDRPVTGENAYSHTDPGGREGGTTCIYMYELH